VWDFGSRRVPNELVGVIAASGLAWQWIAHDVVNLGLALACGVGIIALLWIPWARGGIGGGDVKLAAAAAVWIGHGEIIAYILSGALLGGLVAAGAYVASKRDAKAEIKHNMFLAMIFRAWPSAPTTTEGRVSVPYAFAVFGGSAYALAAPNMGWPV
jgi:prepilin peptidase CpaA